MRHILLVRVFPAFSPLLPVMREKPLSAARVYSSLCMLRDVYELHTAAFSSQQTCKRQLAQKLVDRLLKQSEDPCTYNVLTYALEAFIRGTPLACRQVEQEFLASRILTHLVCLSST